MKKLTVKELKKVLENVPDNLEVTIWSDSGVDQCEFDDDCEVVVEDAFVNKDEFVIYANYRSDEEEDEDDN